MPRTMRDGDIYFWSWKNRDRFMPYHCCAQIAVVKDGVLRDTYWTGTSDNKVITRSAANLAYKGNVADMRTIHESEIAYYKPEDVVDMRHTNDRRAPIYVKKEAGRDAARMTEILEHRIERKRSDIRMAERRIAELEDALSKVASGQLEEVL